MIIDSHNHLGGPDKGDGKSQSADEILIAMDEAGIDMAVVFPFNEAEPGASFSRCNDYIADAVRAHPDRLTGFCRLDPNAGAVAVAELDRAINSLGLSGVKLHPSSQNFALDHPALGDILALAQESGVPALFDTGKRLSPPEGVARLARKFPRLTIIMAHMNLFEETMRAAETAPNILAGTTGYFNMKRLAEGVARQGARRFVMGSDSPYIKMRREVEKIRDIPGLSPEERAGIMGENYKGLCL